MPYGETKVYFDGSHYIAIPYIPNPRKRRKKPPEELITVLEEDTDITEQTQGLDESNDEVKPLVCVPENEVNADMVPLSEEKEPVCEQIKGQKRGRIITRKELFEELYEQTKNKKRSERKRIIIKAMTPYFKCAEDTKYYVERQFERKLRNLICKRVRLVRKVNLQEFNYFCTFTYDGAKHDEESFKKKLKAVLR